MPWPKSTDYIEAVQNLRQSMADEELCAGNLTVAPLGLPMVWSGGFADVYRIYNASTGSNGRRFLTIQFSCNPGFLRGRNGVLRRAFGNGRRT